MNKKYMYAIAAIAIILIAVFGLQVYIDYSTTTSEVIATTTPTLDVATSSINTPATSTGISATSTPSIFILNLKNGTQVQSPLIIKGKARGNWYFEGSFPVKMIDENSIVIGTGHAVALGNWMTEEYVDFQASLEFSKPSTKTGTVVLSKDNPSGLPQNAGEAKVNVAFGESPVPVRVATSSVTSTTSASQ